MFHLVKAKISGVNRDEHVQTTKFVHSSLKHTVDLCSESVVVLKQANRAWKYIGGNIFWGRLGVIVVGLDAEGGKFVANSWPKTAEKT